MSIVGIFGGTFDPIHTGHLITAQAVRELRGLDKIIFIPAFISPHKTEIPTLSPEHRFAMVKLAIKNIPYFDFSDLEINTATISYTIETLRVLIKKYNKIELIIGYDNILKFSSWKEPDEILKLAKIIVLNRKLTQEPIDKDRFYNSALFVDTPTIEISSSEIRERVSKNLPLNFLVPEEVQKYIYHFNLYKEK
ncbi:MAG TPA: nicotinate-nucleotide adenylyltransferase [Ignavibacteriaceae bacterium]|nr:nicotinate-nucleotide adenylyltransferase [Ignavibacteriaceae bacterium]